MRYFNHYKRKVSSMLVAALVATSVSVIPAAVSAAGAPVVNYVNETVTGVTYDVAHQYSVDNGATWKEVKVSGVDVGSVSIVPGTNFKYRLSTTGAGTSLTVPARPVAPASALNSTTETIGTATGIQVSLDGGSNWSSTVTGATYDVSSLIPASNGTNLVVKVRKAATSTAFTSVTKDITLYKRAATPTATFNPSTVKIEGAGVTTAAEYSTNGTLWNKITGTTIDATNIVPASTVTASTYVKLRIKPTSTASASQQLSIEIKPRGKSPINAISGTANDPAFSVTTEELINVDNTMEYAVGASTTYTAVTGTKIDLSSKLGTANTTVKLRYKATSTNVASDADSISLAKRATTPTAVAVDFTKEQVKNLVSGSHEISADGVTYSSVSAATYDVTNLIPSLSTTAKNIYVRVKATSSVPASAPKVVSVVREATPLNTVVKFNPTTETITASTKLEYSLDKTVWTAGAASIDAKSLISSSVTVDVYVRTKATTTKFHSDNLIVTLPKKGTDPVDGVSGGPSLSFATEKLSGLTASHQVTLDGGKTWFDGNDAKKVVSGVVDLKNVIPVSTAKALGKVGVRFKASGSTVSSAVYYYTLPIREVKPVVVAFYPTNTIYGVSDKMEYSTNYNAKTGAGTWTAITGSTLDFTSLLSTTAVVKVSIRVKATGTAPASDIASVDLAKVAAKPTTKQISANDTDNVIVGITNAHEYSLDGTTWTTFNLVSPPVLSGNKTVFVRVKATDKAPAGDKIQLTFTTNP
ncbi:DUF4073 domain-containing protein [Cohnella faecalis]|uniref:DUF4073 domain-containing protein n=1 Tax=Cohnella faecalis TaxID=2315694 RepID=A0A398CFV7_9BACL|nr:DUF4073 domain-containing protein [Cohnella faecalis]RIE02076.1 DUF4073 domain-containing protein [Cohnella faecalis]